MINEKNIRNILTLSLVALVIGMVVILILYVLEKSEVYKDAPYQLGLIVGALVTGQIYGAKTKEMLPMKKRLVLSTILAFLTIALTLMMKFVNGSQVVREASTIDFVKYYSIIIVVYFGGSLLMYSLGNRNAVKVYQHKK